MTYELKGVDSLGLIWGSLKNESEEEKEGFLRSLVVNLRVTVDAIAAKTEGKRRSTRSTRFLIKPSTAVVNGCFAHYFAFSSLGRTVIFFVGRRDYYKEK